MTRYMIAGFEKAGFEIGKKKITQNLGSPPHTDKILWHNTHPLDLCFK